MARLAVDRWLEHAGPEILFADDYTVESVPSGRA
jgi:hypothetical protein